MQNQGSVKPGGVPLLQAEGISKLYNNGVQANQNVNFTLMSGEIHALLGENGAGKSTLVKIFYGMEKPDSGSIYINGEKIDIQDSAGAINAGIGMVHQELMLIPHITVAENVMLGKEIKKFGNLLDRKKAVDTIAALARQHGFEIDPNALVHNLSIGVQQRVEIIKLLYREARVLILDEPTALLTPQEADGLFEVIESLKAEGKSIIFITHKLREVYQVADRMTVMRHGVVVGTTTPDETSSRDLAEMMVGKSMTDEVCRQEHTVSDSVTLSVRNVSMLGAARRPVLDDISFSVHAGEILGVAGIEGNGQSQLAQAIIGMNKIASGEISCEGVDITGQTTQAIRDMGVGSVPDDRQHLGLVLPFSIGENFILNYFHKAPYSQGPLLLNWGEIKRQAAKLIQEFDVRAVSEAVPVGTLSGGNQQKVVVGRELSVPLKLLVAAQPTRGLDFASASFIQKKLMDAAEQGTAVLLFSSDLDELMAISDRIMVMLRGQNVGVVDAAETTKEQLGTMMLGIS